MATQRPFLMGTNSSQIQKDGMSTLCWSKPRIYLPKRRPGQSKERSKRNAGIFLANIPRMSTLVATLDSVENHTSSFVVR
mmetsp:Transcript_66109/g.103221  ORF Transcript_66109/g.103221 Transcript_66109/m.103221 type:complete len:80 (+) Transcript_66109:163-402(+)